MIAMGIDIPANIHPNKITFQLPIPLEETALPSVGGLGMAWPETVFYTPPIQAVPVNLGDTWLESISGWASGMPNKRALPVKKTGAKNTSPATPQSALATQETPRYGQMMKALFNNPNMTPLAYKYALDQMIGVEQARQQALAEALKQQIQAKRDSLKLLAGLLTDTDTAPNIIDDATRQLLLGLILQNIALPVNKKSNKSLTLDKLLQHKIK